MTGMGVPPAGSGSRPEDGANSTVVSTANAASIPNAYKFIGNRAVSDSHVVGLQCDHCRVSWDGCAAESCCPICGTEKGYHADDMGLCYCATCRPLVVAEVDPTRKALERILFLRRQILIDIGARHAARINVADDATIQCDADFRAELEGAFAEAASAISDATGTGAAEGESAARQGDAQ